MKVGFTGTRRGMTPAQRDAFIVLLVKLDPSEFHHGDCIGADAQAAYVAHQRCHVVCHPPVDESLRAFEISAVDSIREPKTHFARNRAIVDETDCLIATPYESEHQPRGGTWYSIDYAKKKQKGLYVIWPDGAID